jgi:hypothetical protein
VHELSDDLATRQAQHQFYGRSFAAPSWTHATIVTGGKNSSLAALGRFAVALHVRVPEIGIMDPSPLFHRGDAAGHSSLAGVHTVIMAIRAHPNGLAILTSQASSFRHQGLAFFASRARRFAAARRIACNWRSV